MERYAALSHRWGENMPLLTTTANLKKRLSGIGFEQLPKTFQEAVTLLRSLSLRYLWIDTLCILQDNKYDWEVQSAAMADIYTNAYITVAAASAEDCQSGLWRPSRKSIGGEWDGTMFHLRTDWLHSNLAESPLVSRGWVMQEQILSRRIIYFADPQLVWRCCSLTESEDGLLDGLFLNDYLWIRNCPLIGDQPTEAKSVDEWRALWKQLAKEFSTRHFTFEEDNLAALAGVTSKFAKLLADQPFLGLWKSNLFEGLLWSVDLSSNDYPVRRTSNNIPSWSWLSIRASIEYEIFLWRNNPLKSTVTCHLRSKIEVIIAEVNWAGTHLTTPVKDSSLVLRGTIFRGCLQSIDEQSLRACRLRPRDSQDIEATKHASSLTLDTPMEPSPDSLWCLCVADIIYFDSEDESSSVRGVAVLILDSIASKHNVYRRIGIGSVYNMNSIVADNMVPEAEITLV